MKLFFNRILLVFLGATSFAYSQNTVNYNINAMVVQGEASGGNLLSDDIGLGLGLGYDFPFGNPRFEFALKFDYVWLNVDYISDLTSQFPAFMQGSMHHLSASGGLNIYLNDNNNLANLYHPFRPYVYGITGLVFQTNSIEHSPAFGFTMVEGVLILPVVEIGGGAKIRINPHWSFNAVFGIRTTLSDDVDGLVGSTGAPDLMGIVRLGVSKRL